MDPDPTYLFSDPDPFRILFGFDSFLYEKKLHITNFSLNSFRQFRCEKYVDITYLKADALVAASHLVLGEGGAVGLVDLAGHLGPQIPLHVAGRGLRVVENLLIRRVLHRSEDGDLHR